LMGVAVMKRKSQIGVYHGPDGVKRPDGFFQTPAAFLHDLKFIPPNYSDEPESIPVDYPDTDIRGDR